MTDATPVDSKKDYSICHVCSYCVKIFPCSEIKGVCSCVQQELILRKHSFSVSYFCDGTCYSAALTAGGYATQEEEESASGSESSGEESSGDEEGDTGRRGEGSEAPK